MTATATAGERRAPVTETTRQLEKLTSIKPGSHWVVSCYLKLEPRDRVRGKYRVKLKNRVRGVLDALPRLGLDKAALDSVSRDMNRIQDHLHDPGTLPDTRGIAIFACEAIGLFEVDAVTRRVSPGRQVTAGRFATHLGRVLTLRGAACARGLAADRVLAACGVTDPLAGHVPEDPVTGREAMTAIQQVAKALQ